jgi:hypothetical protein
MLTQLQQCQHSLAIAVARRFLLPRSECWSSESIASWRPFPPLRSYGSGVVDWHVNLVLGLLFLERSLPIAYEFECYVYLSTVR